jgi:hypothetical protein
MKTRDERKEARKFGLVLGGAALLYAGWSAYHGRSEAAGVGAAIGVVVLALAFVAQAAWLWVFRRWMKAAEAISFVMTRLILGVFFFLVLTPVALFLRVAGKRPLDLTWKDGKASYWIDKPAGEFTVERYRRQY